MLLCEEGVRFMGTLAVAVFVLTSVRGAKVFEGGHAWFERGGH